MTELARNACKAACTTLQLTCVEIESGEVTIDTLKSIQDNNSKVCRLCEDAGMNFDLQGWLDKLSAVQQHDQDVQEFHNHLDPRVQGKFNYTLTLYVE